MKNFDVAILGSGASGCACALTLAESGKQILLIDKHKSVAKKLMATGNGRCNLTNICKDSTIKNYNKNIDLFLSMFDAQDTLNFFNDFYHETTRLRRVDFQR